MGLECSSEVSHGVIEYLDFFLANLTKAMVSYSPWHKMTAQRLYPLTTNSTPNSTESWVMISMARGPW